MTEVESLHRPFLKWCRENGICHTYHRSDRATGATLGDPDVIIYQNNRVLFIEFKGAKTPVSPSQKKRHAELRAAGCAVFVLRDLEAAIAVVREWKAQLPPENPVAGDCAQPRGMYVVNTPRYGDALFSANGDFVRRATFADAGLYPRKA